jgi:hypothetical protein
VARRRKLDLTDYRSVIGTAGDVWVGAYARREQRKRILVALLGVALIIGAVALYWLLRPAGGSLGGGRSPIRVRCTAPGCGYEGVLHVSSRERFPLVCPMCKARSCRELWQCRNPDCGALFLPDAAKTQPRCPVCGSATVGSSALEPHGR